MKFKQKSKYISLYFYLISLFLTQFIHIYITTLSYICLFIYLNLFNFLFFFYFITTVYDREYGVDRL